MSDHLNLLPYDYRRRGLLRRRRKLWVIIWTAGGVRHGRESMVFRMRR